MNPVDLGILVVLGILAATLAGVLLRKLAPIVLQLFLGCLTILIIGWIAKAVLTIGIFKSFLIAVGIVGVFFLAWTYELRHRGR